MVMVSSIASVAYRKPKPKLSDDFINLTLGKIGTWLIFGLLPTLSLAVLYKLHLFNTTVPIHQYILRLLGLQAVAMVLLFIYRKTKHLAIGGLGALAVMGYCFHLIDVLAFLIFPEKWAFHKFLVPYPLYYVTPLVQFAAFIMLSLIMTGAAILFIYYRWSERKLSEDVPHYDLLKYHGFGLAMAGSLIMPLMVIWDLAILPAYSLSVSVFVLAGLIMVVLFFLALFTSFMIRDYKEKKPRYAVIVFVLAIVAFGLVIGKDRTVQANANLETIAVLKMDAQKVWDHEVGRREEIYAKSAGIDPKKGEEIYNQVCTACHAFDTKKLGPPLNTVLPKYVGKDQELIDFINKPRKVDPNYPAMPSPGLTTIKIKSVVKFLMGKFAPTEEEEPAEKEERSGTQEVRSKE